MITRTIAKEYLGEIEREKQAEKEVKDKCLFFPHSFCMQIWDSIAAIVLIVACFETPWILAF